MTFFSFKKTLHIILIKKNARLNFFQLVLESMLTKFKCLKYMIHLSVHHGYITLFFWKTVELFRTVMILQ